MTKRQTPRWGWALTGSGHFLKESLALIRELEHVDIFLSKAGGEVLRMYKQELALSPSTRIYRDTSASSVTVGQFYYGVYHTLIVAPATSNAVAKFVYGISDDLITNLFAQSGKCRVPAIVFACDTAPELETEAPKGMVKVYPRPIDLENRERLGRFRRRYNGRLDRRASRSDRKPTRRNRRMTERILFLTGRLAQDRLEKVLQSMAPTTFDWSILNVGVKVAALMTEPILMRRLPHPLNADRVVVPGRCRADLARLTQEFGRPFQRGPDELKDLPEFFGKAGAPIDLSRHSLRIFAEIVDASQISLEAILARAEILRAEGADVIDLGCLPDTSFPHLEQTVRELKGRGLAVSVDLAEPGELRRGAAAGADYLLSLTEHNVAIAEETGARPVLIPVRHGDLPSLFRAAEEAQKRGLSAILDPVLDPIHFGFAESLLRYRKLRARLPEAEMLMGTGNLTELTDADSVGVTALLLGILLGTWRRQRLDRSRKPAHAPDDPRARRGAADHARGGGGPQPAERLWTGAVASSRAFAVSQLREGDRGIRCAGERQ